MDPSETVSHFDPYREVDNFFHNLSFKSQLDWINCESILRVGL